MRLTLLIAALFVLAVVGCGTDEEEGIQAPDAAVHDVAIADVGDETTVAPDIAEIDSGSPDVPEPDASLPNDGSASPEDVPKPPKDTPKPDCDALAAAGLEAAAMLNTCVSPKECGAVQTTICGLCTAPVNTSVDATALEAAAAEWETACGSAAPDDCCQAPTPASYGCKGGQCVGCEYTCNMDCVCKKDLAGCDLPECEADQCVTIESSIDALLPGVSGCTSAGECTLFEYPICGSAGCFQRAVNKEADISSLWELAEQGQTAGCSGFTCGCGYGTMPVCLGSECVLCPGPNCNPSCDTLLATIKAEAALAKACTDNWDCKLLDSPICGEPGLGCYAVAVATTTPLQKNLTALLDLYADLGCPTADCDCDEPVATCSDGQCISWSP